MTAVDNTQRGKEWPEIYSRRVLNQMYRAIPLKDTTFRLLRKYFNALTNLYGAVPLRQVYKIITAQNPKLVTQDEFLAFSEVARHECEDYYLLGLDELYVDGPDAVDPMDRELIDIALIDESLDRYHELLRQHQGKPYFVPKKSILLAYEDAFYCELSPQAVSLRSFLSKRLHNEDTMVDSIMEELIYSCRCLDAGIAEVIQRVDQLGITFKKRGLSEEFIMLYQDFHNNTRMQANRGYTPNELLSLCPPEQQVPQSISLGPNIRKGIADGSIRVSDLRHQILSAQLPNEDLRRGLLKELAEIQPPKAIKIGRNELCPCGSGKKYKKCCGR